MKKNVKSKSKNIEKKGMKKTKGGDGKKRANNSIGGVVMGTWSCTSKNGQHSVSGGSEDADEAAGLG